MESLDFPVGLGSVGPGSFVGDAELGAGVSPGVGAVAASVVGQDAFDGDAMVGEPFDGAMEHSDRGVGLLIGADLDVGDARVVIDHGVHERSADHRFICSASRSSGAHDRRHAVPVSLLFADVAPPTTVRDVAELGDIDMDHRPGMGVFVAADRFTGDPVDAAEPVHPTPHQHRVDRRGRDPEPASDLHRSEAVPPPQAHDLPHHGRWRLIRAGTWPRGPVGHPGRAFVSEPGSPFAGRHGRDHEHLRRLRRRPAILNDQFREPQTGTRGQSSVSVGHEGLLCAERLLDISTPQPEAFAVQQIRSVSRNNVPGHHS
ncbi:conserved hypothetical protein [Aeromicrobium sp. 9AM]|nr:conserved hypothetical protein [Aeromicrobium sp. 9AM]